MEMTDLDTHVQFQFSFTQKKDVVSLCKGVSMKHLIRSYRNNLLGDNTRKQAENREMNETRTHKGREISYETNDT